MQRENFWVEKMTKEIDYNSLGDACTTLRFLANAKRLPLLCRIGEEEVSAGDLAEFVGMRPSALSQHLRQLKEAGIVEARREHRLSEALLATGFHYRRDELADSNLQHFTDLSYITRGLRRLGSAACDLCYVACGRYDGYWEPHLAPWDVAAGALIAREAGAFVGDFSGGDEWLFGRQIVAANEALAREILAVLAAADPARLPGPRYRA